MTPASRTGRRERGDDGFTTVASLGLLAVVVAATLVVLALGVVQVTRHRAESAADLAALAAAHHALEGREAACHAARKVAEAQRARLDRCALDGLDAVVRVTVPLPGRLAAFGPVPAQARAGAR
jgi:secretion/DNA translocation related TadE-like protein